MLSRIYIDNYKCLVNFTLELGGLTILHGDNGSGKSTVFEALRAIRKLLVGGHSAGEAFPPESKTRFERRDEQHFELDFVLGSELYAYVLVVRQPPEDHYPKSVVYIAHESLKCNDIPLFDSDNGAVNLYAYKGQPAAAMQLNPRTSALVMLHPQYHGAHPLLFWYQISNLILLRLEPSRMSADADPEPRILADDGVNFPTWWHNFIAGANSHLLPILYEHLGDVIEGFRGITIQDSQSSRRFAALIERKDNGGGAYKYGISELSDGERVLLVLYSLVYGLEPGSHILCLDEPDNFVSLPELHPWLMALYEMCEDKGQQALVISHHPEFYDFLGGRRSIWLKREANGPSRVIDQPQYPGEEDKQGLKLSELVARRWLP
jgi:energy-coupling factor transporter ATP-binding protein EcfA2